MSCRATQQQGSRLPPLPTIPTIALEIVATEVAVQEAAAPDPTRRQILVAGGLVSIVSLVGFVLWFNM